MKITLGTYYDDVRKENISCLVIDGKSFTWGVLPESLRKAKEAWISDPTIKDAIMMDIRNHFLTSLCKFTGEKITIQDINKALDDN